MDGGKGRRRPFRYPALEGKSFAARNRLPGRPAGRSPLLRGPPPSLGSQRHRKRAVCGDKEDERRGRSGGAAIIPIIKKKRSPDRRDRTEKREMRVWVEAAAADGRLAAVRDGVPRDVVTLQGRPGLAGGGCVRMTRGRGWRELRGERGGVGECVLFRLSGGRGLSSGESARHRAVSSLLRSSLWDRSSDASYVRARHVVCHTPDTAIREEAG
ncbi:hypothetical protein HPB50_016445 [Hyalomma asiaticum]|uniref:Uncharacterized protein n=1 Tax=Hyalomma asiaticum TaxID=266040 RepID=A0ACB7SNX8_HYAAI|nr:hypothetical protein HPB50_016445 [Hyalomma asiaticum]